MDTKQKYEKFLLGNYGEAVMEFVSAKGSYVFDESNKKYLDFGGGIAVMSLGHSNKNWVNALTRQANTLVHCSNLYRHQYAANLAESLIAQIGKGKMFFCNSGTEANEALIKASRLYGETLSPKRHKVLVAINGFHGRTMGALSATMQEKIQKHFAPYLPEFIGAEFNNSEAFEKIISKGDIAVVILEPIQGESGILPATKEFLKRVRSACTKHSTLLFLDEIQCGVGRTGKFLACEHYGISPDGISLAKGLGGGFPIGAMYLKDSIAKLFTVGTHGTTFGGNPLACAVASEVLKEIKKQKLCENAKVLGEFLIKNLTVIAKKYPAKIKSVRGMGLMIGILINDNFTNATIINNLRKNGLITVGAGANAVRFLPPLNVKKSEVLSALKIFEKTIKEL